MSPQTRDALLKEVDGMSDWVADLVRTAEHHEQEAAALRRSAAVEQAVIQAILDDLNDGPDRGVE